MRADRQTNIQTDTDTLIAIILRISELHEDEERIAGTSGAKWQSVNPASI